MIVSRVGDLTARTSERRAYTRFPIDLQVELRISGRRFACRMRDLSEGGAFIECTDRKKISATATECRLGFLLPQPVGDAVRVDAEIVRREQGGFGVRFVQASARCASSLRAFIRECERSTGAMLATADTAKAGPIMHRVITEWLPGMVDAMQTAILNDLWQTSAHATSNVERSAIGDDISAFDRAIEEARLQGMMEQALLAPTRLQDADNDSAGPSAADSDALQLMEQERFDVWLASSALAGSLEEALEEPLAELREHVQRIFGQDAQLPVEPQGMVAVLELVLTELELSTTTIALCIRAAQPWLVDALLEVYGELVRAWQAGGLSTPETEGLETSTPSEETQIIAAEALDDSSTQRSDDGAEREYDSLGTADDVHGDATEIADGERDRRSANAQRARVIMPHPDRAPHQASSGLDGQTLGHEQQPMGTRTFEQRANTGEQLAAWLLSLDESAYRQPAHGHASAGAAGLTSALSRLLEQPADASPQLDVRLAERITSTDRVLGHMLHDSRVPDDLRELIGKLVTRFAASAVRDPDFYRDAEHPLIDVLDRLEQLSALAPDSDDLSRMEQRILETDVDDLAAVRSLATELDGAVDRYASKFQRNVERLVANCEYKERSAEAKRKVRALLDGAFAGRSVHRAVLGLLENGWRALLEMVYLRRGERSLPWKRYCQTLFAAHARCGGEPIDDADLATDSGELLEALREGLERVEFDPLRRTRLLESIRAAVRASRVGTLTPGDFVLYPEDNDESSEPPPSGMPRDVSLDAWRRALDTVDRLPLGTLLKIKAGPELTMRRLVWRNDDGDSLLLVDAQGEAPRTLDRAKLAKALARGKAEAQEPVEHGLTVRAMDSVLQEMQERITHRAERVSVGGLSHRGRLIGKLAEMVTDDLSATRNATLGLVALDHFEAVTGSFGYEAGERLLMEIARLLEGTITGDACIAHLGGARFGFLVALDDEALARTLAEHVRSAIAMLPFKWGGKACPVLASVGLVMLTQGYDHPEALLSAADTACTAAQRAGGDRVVLFREGDEAITREKTAMDGWLKAEGVVRSQHVRLRCQPIVAADPTVEAPHHYEVLLSVYDDKHAPIRLDEFINSAEAFSRMAEIDRIVLDKAVNWVHDQPAAAARLGGLAINLSGQSLGDEGLVARVQDYLERLAIDPRLISFEVTETAAIANLDRAVAIIEGIKSLGCRFALDDFGAGMASFTYVKRMPVDYLKIDGYFVKDLLTNPADEAIVKSINEVAHFMGKETIAEFVESNEIRERLVEIGVDYVQGYAVGKPRFLDEMNDPQ